MKELELIKKALPSINFDLLNIWVTNDRFDDGLQALVNWHRIGQTWNEICTNAGIKRGDRVKVFTTLVGNVSKDDRPASGIIAQYPLDKLKTWYTDNKMFAVSPRSILKKWKTALVESKEAGKSDIEQLTDKIKKEGRKAIAKDTKALELIAALEKAITEIHDLKRLKVVDNLLASVTDELNMKINGLNAA